MAKYVLFSFESDAEADKFVASVPGEANARGDEVPLLVAEFKKPTQYCKCTDKERAGKLGVRGSKYGWFVCGNCKKPAKNGNQVIYNLLENDGRPPWHREIMLQVLSRYWTAKEKKKGS